MRRQFIWFNLNDQTSRSEQWEGEALVKAGRHLIAKTLVERGVATVDPLGPENPLIFSAGPLAGTTFSNANRLSVGCRSGAIWALAPHEHRVCTPCSRRNDNAKAFDS